jgi:hypothetical protein
MPQGDVLRFYQYYRTWHGEDPVIVEDEGDFLWAYMTSPTAFIVIWASDSVLHKIGDPPGGSVDHERDDFEVIPVDDWPGEVCAYFAKRALLEGSD